MKCYLAVPPALEGKASYALELLLEGLGYKFERVDVNEQADIVYSSEMEHSETCSRRKLRILHCSGDLWDENDFKIADIGGLKVPFRGVPPQTEMSGGANIVEVDLVYATYALATGVLERGQPKSHWGGVPGRQGIFARLGLNTIPLIAAYEQYIGDRLISCGFPPGVPMWPHGKKHAVVVTHDVDQPFYYHGMGRFRWDSAKKQVREKDYLGATRSVMGGARRFIKGRVASLSGVAGDPNFRFDDWGRAESKMPSGSAYYVAVTSCSMDGGHARDVPYDFRHPSIVRELLAAIDRGSEVGLHASINSRLNEARLKFEKEALESILGGYQISGVRHHYWSLDHDHAERTLWGHAKAGFKYDTSFGLSDTPGFRRGLARPFSPYDCERDEKVPILELPTTFMDRTIFDYVRDAECGEHLLHEHIQHVFDFGGTVVFNMHLETLNPKLIKGGGYVFLRVLQNLAESRDIFWTTPNGLVNWWTERGKQIAVTE